MARWTFRGTHEGELMGIAPTGNRVEFAGIVIYQVVDGKIVEGWVSSDALGLKQQLGILPPPR